MPPGLCFPVEFAADGTLVVKVSGKEKDLGSDDTLPGFTLRFGAADRFGVGEHTQAASNRHMSYRMTFTIEPTDELEPCLPPPDVGGGGGGGGRPPGSDPEV